MIWLYCAVIAMTTSYPRSKNNIEEKDFPSNDEEAYGFIENLINHAGPRNEHKVHCSFIENKKIDYPLIQKLLKVSSHQNHWANFGPVSRMLERYLFNELNVHNDKAVVMCKSATDALFVGTNIKSINKGRPLRWVISAFGFFSTDIGTLSQSIVLDCDSSGLLDIKELKTLDSDSWDGLIVTNVFGLYDDLSEYIDFCREEKKEIVIDNAVGFYYSSRKTSTADEVISFHQTKPWGIGEGGCLIVDNEYADLARSLINFGVGEGDEVRPYCMNSKLSDFDSALILQRLLNRDKWEPRYIEQAERIRNIVIELGLSTLSGIPNGKIMGNIPVVCPGVVQLSKLLEEDGAIQFGKYYKPLSPNKKQSSDLFDRMLNIPCHGELANLSDNQITDSIRSILG